MTALCATSSPITNRSTSLGLRMVLLLVAVLIGIVASAAKAGEASSGSGAKLSVFAVREPDCWVLANDVYVGMTPFRAKDVPAGAWMLRVVCASGKTLSKRVGVTPGTEMRLIVRPNDWVQGSPNPIPAAALPEDVISELGYISLKVVDLSAARIYVDGEFVGYSPLILYKVRHGTHTIRIVEEVGGRPGRVKTLEVALGPRHPSNPLKVIVAMAE